MTQAATSVLVNCTCGSRAWISEKFSGRKIRCRACRKVIRVPSLVTSGWEEPDGQRWKMSDAGEDLVVFTPLATESTDELRLMPEVQRPSVYSDELCRPGMRRSPAAVRRLTETERMGRAPARSSGADRRRSTSTRERGSAGAWQPRHEAHVRAISIWYGLSALIIGLLTLVATNMLTQTIGSGAGATSFLIGGTIAGLFAVVTLGLWRMHNWARWIAVALTTLSLLFGLLQLVQASGLAEVLGVVLSKGFDIGVMWALLCPTAMQVFSAQYQSRDASRKPAVEWWFSPFFYIPVLLFLLGLFASLALLVAAF